MSRHHLASIVSTVEGIQCAPYHVQSLADGLACVAWAGRTEDDGEFADGWLTTWQVRVNLPKDVEAAERRIEQLVDPLTDAIQSHRYTVTAAEPAEVNLGGATTNALVITVTDLN